MIKGLGRWAVIYNTRGHTKAIDQMLSVTSLCIFNVQYECYLTHWEMRIFPVSTEMWGGLWKGGVFFGKCVSFMFYFTEKFGLPKIGIFISHVTKDMVIL